MSLASGSRLGPFDIHERVDIPGIPEVYAARDPEYDRWVFIHVLRTVTAQDEAVRDRFERDVLAAAARIQPHLPTIHLIGVDAHAIYVVSDPIHAEPVPVAAPAVVAPVASPVAAPVPAETPVRGTLRASRGGWIAAAIVVAAVAVGMFALGRDEARVEPAAPQGASVPPAPAPPASPATAPVTAVPEQPIVLPEPEADDVAAELRRRGEVDGRPGDPVVVLPPPVARVEPAPPAPAPAPAPPPPPKPVASDNRSTTTLITEATVRATEFDLEGALAILDAAAGRGDLVARVGMLYLRGVNAARDAFRDGGSGDALKPVQESLTSLNEIAKGRPGAAEISRLMLQAAMAAAQTERDEMRLYIESATQMEGLQLAAGQSGAPLIPAGELAGDLWLQVHGYEDARRAYMAAAERSGPTLRTMSGLARVARRLNETAAACTAYRRLLDTWGARPGLPVEIAEARAYLGGCAR